MTTRVALLACRVELCAAQGRTADADAAMAEALQLSAATGVVRAAPCDVFVIHEPAEEIPGPDA